MIKRGWKFWNFSWGGKVNSNSLNLEKKTFYFFYFLFQTLHSMQCFIFFSFYDSVFLLNEHFICINVVLLIDKLTPSAFEKHSGRETARKWKNNVWVIVNGEKVPLCKTVLLKYYNQVSKAANGSHRSQNGRACHRDEFVRCTSCNKERRFRLRTKEECRIHHDALADANWKCSDLPYDKYVFFFSYSTLLLQTKI